MFPSGFSIKNSLFMYFLKNTYQPSMFNEKPPKTCNQGCELLKIIPIVNQEPELWPRGYQKNTMAPFKGTMGAASWGRGDLSMGGHSLVGSRLGNLHPIRKTNFSQGGGARTHPPCRDPELLAKPIRFFTYPLTLIPPGYLTMHKLEAYWVPYALN